ncbi:MAG: ABC transporter substrate-binding protein [Alphaproteobacteria bacterium]|nr:ABC transporter substrate-binding protein [Alphaproteobacteria bacterium]
MTQTAHADDGLHARAFVDMLAKQIISILTTKTTATAREAAFADLLDTHANMRRIARFTLGATVRTISDKDFMRFQNLFRQLVVKVYANRLTDYRDETLEILGVQQKGRNFIVASQIIFATGRPPINVDWWVIRKKNGRYSLFDLRVLGIWLAQEQRETFTSVLRNNGSDIEVLLQHLQKQISD